MFIQLKRQTSLGLALSTALLLMTGCDSGDADDEAASDTGDTDTGGDALPIIGQYTDEWGETHTITEATWTTSVATFHIEEWDAEGMYLVAQNDEANEYSPGLWSRFDWAWSDDDLLYCQSVFDGATVDEAHAGSANHDDLLLGCGGFPWTNMTP